jgi:hypothetical protein
MWLLNDLQKVFMSGDGKPGPGTVRNLLSLYKHPEVRNEYSYYGRIKTTKNHNLKNCNMFCRNWPT